MAPSSRGQASRSTSLTSRLSSIVYQAPSIVSRVPRPVFYLGTFLATSYFATTFLVSKLAALHARVTAEQNSKEDLRKRFTQNQNDVAFTIMALLPTLGKEINTLFDVDGITEKIRMVGREAEMDSTVSIEPAANSGSAEPKLQAQKDQESLKQEVEKAPMVNGHREPSHSTEENAGPTSALDAISEPLPPPVSPLASLPTSQMASPRPEVSTESVTNRTAKFNRTAEAGSSEAGPPSEATPLLLNGDGAHSQAEEAQFSPPPVTADLRSENQETLPGQTNGHAEAKVDPMKAEDERQRLEQAAAKQQARQAQLSADRKRKAALWEDLKVVAISRTLTTFYAVNLLSLLTHVQLSLLGRYGYLAALAGAQDSGVAQDPSTVPLDPFEEAWSRSNPAAAESSTMGQKQASGSAGERVSQETEERYLTFSWYFLHHGWRLLAERVRSKVEDSVSGVPLKAQLTHADLVTLMRRIRRRIEYEYEEIGDPDEAGSFTSASPARSAYSIPDTSMDQMATGAESLAAPLPLGSFSGEENDSMSASFMSGATNSTSRSKSRRRKKRINLLERYLLPSTPEGDLDLLQSSGLLSAEAVGSGPSSLPQYDPVLSALLDETRDLLDSKDAHRVFKSCLWASFDEWLVRGLRPAFGLGLEDAFPDENQAEGGFSFGQQNFSRIRELPASYEASEDPELVGKPVRLAALLPMLTKLSTLGLTGLPSDMVEAIGNVKDLKAWDAIVYASWAGQGEESQR